MLETLLPNFSHPDWQPISTKAQGVTCIAFIAAVALFFASHISLISASLLALLIGAAVANIATVPDSMKPGIKFCEKKILEVAIVLLGFNISLTSLAQDIALLPTLAAVCGALLLGLVIAKRLGYQPGTSALVGIGCAICGSAAIAAAQKPLKSSQEDIANALAGIHIVGFTALFLIPIAAEFLELSPDQTALLIGGSLPAMGHVVAAGFSISAEVGEQATIIKLARIALLLPVLIGLYLWQPQKAGFKNAVTSIPAFIVIFAAVVVGSSFIELPETVGSIAKTASSIALTMALAAIGCQLNFANTLKKTTRALQLTAATIVVQLGLLLLL